MRAWLTAALMGAMTAGAALADVALVIGSPDTERRGLLGGTSLDTSAALRGAGFDVIFADTSSAQGMREALSSLLARAEEEPRVVIHLTGSVLRGPTRGWLVQDPPGSFDLATADDHGLSLDMVLDVAALWPGQAVVAIGLGEAPELGPGLRAGLAVGVIPQGVTVFDGPEAAIARLVRERVLVPGLAPNRMAAGANGVRARGYLGRAAFLPEGEERPLAPPDPAEVERAVWQAAQAQDSASAYEGYLARYPEGLFAADAQAAIEAIAAEPLRDARLAEEALALDRDARRQIQRNLTVLDFDPRGIDGIFGPGTRTALRRFQLRNGFPETGYLDRVQVERLALQSARRQAELEAEAERRRLEQERQDRATWEATGRIGDEAGLRTYLRRYPDGLFAAEARRQISEIEAAKRQEAEAQERIAWEEADREGTEAAFVAYLRRYPDGAFAEAARTRLNRLQAESSEEVAAARAAEARLGLPGVTLILVEKRLDQLGLQPGEADGRLDEESRAAIRRFQAQRELPVTGYLNELTLARMLAEVGPLLIPD